MATYKRNSWTDTSYWKPAGQYADAAIRTQQSASQRERNTANTAYGNYQRTAGLQQANDTRNLYSQYQQRRATTNNRSLGSGMGYGRGYQQTQANQAGDYNRGYNDLLQQYLINQQNALAERNNVYANADEADRLAAANRQVELLKYFQQLSDSGFNRYTGIEGLRQAEIESRNAAALAKKSIY